MKKLVKSYHEGSSHGTEEHPTLTCRVQYFECSRTEKRTMRIDWTLDRVNYFKTRKAAKASKEKNNDES